MELANLIAGMIGLAIAAFIAGEAGARRGARAVMDGISISNTRIERKQELLDDQVQNNRVDIGSLKTAIGRKADWD